MKIKSKKSYIFVQYKIIMLQKITEICHLRCHFNIRTSLRTYSYISRLVINVNVTSAADVSLILQLKLHTEKILILLNLRIN